MYSKQIALLAALGVVAAYENVRMVATQHTPDLHYYQCRHTEEDWSQPCTIEDKIVWANFWGTVVTQNPIDFGSEGNRELSREEGEAIMMLSITASASSSEVEGRFQHHG